MSTAANVDRRSPEFLAYAMGISYEVPNQVVERMPQPMVSVRTVTFRHAAYLRQCIEGVLMQRTSFPFEYVIGEDFSDDDTRAIAFEYAAKYPDRIRLITADENVGMRANGHRIREACRGKYHALCEGDDYWTDPLKLQKQVDLLEADPSVSMVFHNVWLRHEESRWDRFLNHRIKKDRFTLADVLLSEWFVGTCSMVYRKSAIEGVDLAQFRWSLSGDMVLQFHLALKGDFVYMDEVMGVYRRHGGGISQAYWPSTTPTEAHQRQQFEVFRPNHIWMQLAFQQRVSDAMHGKLIERRIAILMGMIAEYLLQQRSDGLPRMAEVRERLVALVEKGRPDGFHVNEEVYRRAVIEHSAMVVQYCCLRHMDTDHERLATNGLGRIVHLSLKEMGKREYPRKRILFWMLRALMVKLEGGRS